MEIAIWHKADWSIVCTYDPSKIEDLEVDAYSIVQITKEEFEEITLCDYKTSFYIMSQKYKLWKKN